jgi:multidrug transporter EmrE-like cation transporter
MMSGVVVGLFCFHEALSTQHLMGLALAIGAMMLLI